MVRRSTWVRAFVVGWMLAGLMPIGPATANPHATDGGTVMGTVRVGKVATTCTKTDGGVPAGAGLGFPVASSTKNAYFLAEGTVTSVTHGAGDVRICGFLEPALSAAPPAPGQIKPGIGAACGFSKGHGGQGYISFGGPPSEARHVIWLNNVGWKSTAGGVLPMTGEASTTANKGMDKDGDRGSQINLPSLGQGGAACADKRDAPPFGAGPKNNEGATTFAWRGGYAIDARPYTDPNDLPLMCKTGPPCLYREKKTP